MKKDNAFNDGNYWYQLWMKQSKHFLDSTDDQLKKMFATNATANPEEHFKQFQQWLEALKNQWQTHQLTSEQKAYQAYWQMMTKMFQDTSEMMMEQWMKRAKEQHPIKTLRELHELWASCCHEVYQKSLQSKMYQETYNEFMQAAVKFWQADVTK